MSFLWRSSSDSSGNLCKLCIEKDKRISNYEVFFDETKDVLKEKEAGAVDLQIKLSEKISELELIKKQYDAEKRQWLEDRKIWQETNKKHQNEAIEWEIEKTRYEEFLEDMNSEKMISMKYQKTLEDKISNLVHSLKEADTKYQNLMERITEQNVIQSDEIREREEDIISIYDKKIEELIEDYDERENEWLSKESDLQLHIQNLEEQYNYLEMKILDLKYDQECLIEKHTQELRDQEEKWDKRVCALNESYDVDFIQFKKHFKLKEDSLEKEKAELMVALQTEIEKLKKENEMLEESKQHVEKKIVEINHQNKILHLTVQETKEKNEQLESELNTNKKILENHILEQTVQNTQPMRVQSTNLVNLDSESLMNCSGIPVEEECRRKKKKSTKKRNNILGPNQNVFNGFYHPYVETMDKSIESNNRCDLGSINEKKTEEQIDHVSIDIQDDNFFLPRIESDQNSVLYRKLKDCQNQLKQYEQELDNLRIQNSEFVNKIKTYECNSILQFNRNLRSGIPVKFFPHHTNYFNPIHSFQTTNQINHCTID